MITFTAFTALCIIVDGELTVHTLRMGYLDRASSEESADIHVLSDLIELADAGLIRWVVYEDYGNGPALRPKNLNANEMLESWYHCFGLSGPRGDLPDGPTISIERTALAVEVVNQDLGGLYERFHESWYSWLY